jgi:hypothetical protein
VEVLEGELLDGERVITGQIQGDAGRRPSMPRGPGF